MLLIINVVHFTEAHNIKIKGNAMQLTGERKNNAFVVDIKGRMDLDSSDKFNSYVDRFIAENKTPFVLNCRELEYINSSGLRDFIYLTQKLGDLKQSLLICELQEPVMEVINIAELGSYFKIFADEKEAFENL
jgi:anti-sigma B factor antagonist